MHVVWCTRLTRQAHAEQAGMKSTLRCPARCAAQHAALPGPPIDIISLF